MAARRPEAGADLARARGAGRLPGGLAQGLSGLRRVAPGTRVSRAGRACVVSSAAGLPELVAQRERSRRGVGRGRTTLPFEPAQLAGAGAGGDRPGHGRLARARIVATTAQQHEASGATTERADDTLDPDERG